MNWIQEGLGNINYWHVILASVAVMVVGYIWYSDILFGKRWRKETGIGNTSSSGNTAFLGYLTTLVMTSFLYGILLASNTTVTADAVWLAIVLAIGFNASAIFINNLYQKKNAVLSAIDSGYQIVALAIAAAVFTSLM